MLDEGKRPVKQCKAGQNVNCWIRKPGFYVAQGFQGRVFGVGFHMVCKLAMALSIF